MFNRGSKSDFDILTSLGKIKVRVISSINDICRVSHKKGID